MGLPRDHRLGKRPYTKPDYKSKSISEIAAILQEDWPRVYGAQKSRPSMEEIARPILLIEDYADHAHSIKTAIQNRRMQCHLSIPTDNSQLPLACQAAGAVQPDVLLLDLRQFKGGRRDILSEISREPHLRRIPLVMLVDSAADSQISKDHDLRGCWRLTTPVNSEQCVRALISLVRLRKAILELPLKEKQKKDGSARARDSEPRPGDEAGGEIRRIDWEGLCKDINE